MYTNGVPGINRVQLCGNLVKDPYRSENNKSLTSLRVAVSCSYKRADNTWDKDTTFIDVVAWDRLGEICADKLKKGDKIFIEGRVSFRKIKTTDNGVQKEMTVPSIKAENITNLGCNAEFNEQ